MNCNLVRYSLFLLLIAAVGSIQRTAAQTEQARQITMTQDMAPIGLAFGEPGTGRLQMAASIFLKLDRLDPSPLVSMELVDNSNGRTSALLLPAVQVIREARCCRN